MTPDFVSSILRETLMAAFWISAPLLVIGLVAGVLMSLLQIVTAIQDSAFSAAPRLAAFLAGIILLMPWMLMKMMAFTSSILGNLSRFAH
ncbi:MAG TPA: flagellar biosynthetic protein FliQ [Bryobacteraceae bacterium]|jgi:flagellar biosynthesis protein FliQ|nr:flagellar biosynthetic protein FliQ [Bryobacteraceae bacterium]